jgi:basic amino acid/polyamine antiporter, APA family
LLSEPMIAGGQWTGNLVNLPAVIVVLLITYLLVRGVRESARANNVVVAIKIAAILIFIFAAASSIKTENWHPFVPNGFPGVLTGAAIVFFTYIGFDGVSTAAEECRNPQRDVPFGILTTIAICTVLYVGVAVVLTGIVNYKSLNTAAPVADALKALGYNGVRQWVVTGALMGMVSAILCSQYGQSRIWFAMSRDRLLPDLFSKVHKVFRTPHISTWVAGIAVAIPAGIWDLGTFADLTNIGTLFAFIVVSAGVLVLRKKQPKRHRTFRVPLVPFLPVLSMCSCFVLMLGLPLETWIRFIVWLLIGLAIYFSYSRKRSTI